jgi:dTDP-4-amino-4,6-dideoxygalactose transaminase
MGDGPLRLVATARGAEHAWHLAVVRAPDRDRVRTVLSRLGVETAVHYPVPCHQQEPYRRFADGALPIAEAAAGEVLSLPLFPHMTPAQVDRVCRALREAAAEAVVARGA